ncbi:hypothetical protein CRYUN_Cryun15aG0114800 [Craigia yunnanensis]
MVVLKRTAQQNLIYFEKEDVIVSSKAMERISEIILTLSEENGWRGIHPFPYYLEGIMLAQECLRVECSDIIVCSTPKSGVTWIKAHTFYVVTRHYFDELINPLLFKGPHYRLPTFERILLDNKSNVREPGDPKYTFVSVFLFAASNKDFSRKGKVGDWSNYLTPQMENRLDRITQQKLKGYGLTFSSS